MAKLADIFGRMVGDTYTGAMIADYMAEHVKPSVDELAKFEGVDTEMAKTLLMVMEGSAEYLAGTKAVCVTRPDIIASQLAWLRWEERENCVVITLDSSYHIIGKHTVTIGLANQTLVDPREVFRFAILDNATCIIIGHNHPSGCLEPSRDDISLTRVIAAAGRIMKIPLLDHVIVSRSGFTSICNRHPELFEVPATSF